MIGNPNPSIPRGITKNHLFSPERCSAWNKICTSLQAGRIFACMHLVTGHSYLKPSYLIAVFLISEAVISRQWPYRLYFQEKCHFFWIVFPVVSDVAVSLYYCFSDNPLGKAPMFGNMLLTASIQLKTGMSLLVWIKIKMSTSLIYVWFLNFSCLERWERLRVNSDKLYISHQQCGRFCLSSEVLFLPGVW